VVEVEVDHVEPIGLAGHELDEPDVVRQGIAAARIPPEGQWGAGD